MKTASLPAAVLAAATLMPALETAFANHRIFLQGHAKAVTGNRLEINVRPIRLWGIDTPTNVDYGGETAVIDNQGEIVRAVLPVPGRAFVFRSDLQHAARPVARSCAIVRRMIVFKCGAWPVDMPIRFRAPDDLENTFNTATHEPFSGFASLAGRQRTAAASWPHRRTNCPAHLTNTALSRRGRFRPRG